MGVKISNRTTGLETINKIMEPTAITHDLEKENDHLNFQTSMNDDMFQPFFSSGVFLKISTWKNIVYHFLRQLWLF